MDGLLFAPTLCAALGCGVVAGVFFAFSAFVMEALGRLPAPQAIAAMQAINAAAPAPAFMATLLGTALACCALVVSSLLTWDEPSAPYLIAGGGLYLVGAIGPTGIYHVPRNEAMAQVEPSGADAGGLWARYRSGWTAWNHVRATAALAAATTLAFALHVG